MLEQTSIHAYNLYALLSLLVLKCASFRGLPVRCSLGFPLCCSRGLGSSCLDNMEVAASVGDTPSKLSLIWHAELVALNA